MEDQRLRDSKPSTWSLQHRHGRCLKPIWGSIGRLQNGCANDYRKALMRFDWRIVRVIAFVGVEDSAQQGNGDASVV